MILIVYQKSWYVQRECEAEGGLGKNPRRMLRAVSPTDIQLHGFESDPWHNPWWLHYSQKPKDRWKCLICLFSNVAICLMNEIDFIKCQGYLLVSNLEYKHSFTVDLSACIYNGFKVKYREGYVALILPEEVKINRRVGLNKGFDNRERTNLKCWSTMIAFKHLHKSYWSVV